MMQLVQGQHPFTRIAKTAPLIAAKDGGDLDFSPLARLVRVICASCYDYWLREDDPLTWFLDRCSIPVADFHSSKLFQAISHATMERHLATVTGLDLDQEPIAGLRSHARTSRPHRYSQVLPGDAE